MRGTPLHFAAHVIELLPGYGLGPGDDDWVLVERSDQT